MKKYSLTLFLLIIFFFYGCVNRNIYLSERLTESYMRSRWLPPLDASRTTREQVVEKLGNPSGTFENGRIYTYRLIINEWKEGMSDSEYLDYCCTAYYNEKTLDKRFEQIDGDGALLVVTEENMEKYEKEIISSMVEFHLILAFTADGILNRYSLIRVRP